MVNDLNIGKRVLITGGAGVIGSELAGRLLDEGNEVIVYDNLSSGKLEHIRPFEENKKFRFIKADILDVEKLKASMKECDVVFHLAANPDIKFKDGDPTDKDLKQNTIGTYNVLDCMNQNGIKKIIFSSTSAVYGETRRVSLTEDYGPLNPISFYGASKLSCEALISAFCGMLGFQGWIFRFANIIGGKSRKTGTTVITDFILKLKQNPKELEILGDGTQRKTYLLLDECVDGMLFGFQNANANLNIFNLAPSDNISVKEIADIVVKNLKLKDVGYSYSGGDRGWQGDVPYVLLSPEKMQKLGWKAKHTSKEAVEIATEATVKNLQKGSV